MTGRIYINGVDAKAAYGLCLRDNSYGEFNKKPKRKYEYVQSWNDQNGTSRFPLTTPKFESRVLSVPVQISGSDDADYLAKDTAFYNQVVLAGGYLRIFVEDIGSIYYLLYDGTTATQQVMDPSTGRAVKSNFNLELIDDFYTPSLIGTIMYYGTGTSVPTTEAQVLALSAASFATPVLMETGTGATVFIIALPVDAVISSVIDQDASFGADITDLWTLRSTIDVDGQQTSIWAMETSVPYSESHTLQINIE